MPGDEHFLHSVSSSKSLSQNDLNTTKEDKSTNKKSVQNLSSILKPTTCENNTTKDRNYSATVIERPKSQCDTRHKALYLGELVWQVRFILLLILEHN